MFEDARCEGRPIKVDFKGALRPEREPAVEALAAWDIGVLVALPAFDKTVVAANLIARRKVSTLVLVEKVTLLEQWKDRLDHAQGEGPLSARVDWHAQALRRAAGYCVHAVRTGSLSGGEGGGWQRAA